MDPRPEYFIPSFALAVAIFVLSILDVVTTNRGAKAGLTEENPLMAWVQKTFGPAWQFVRVGLAILVAAALLFLPEPISVLGLFAIAFLYGITVWNNYRLLVGK